MAKNQELSNEMWYVYQIRNADSHRRLENLSIMIDYDKWENVEYTKDEESMAMIRREWAKRRDELCNQASDQTTMPKAN